MYISNKEISVLSKHRHSYDRIKVIEGNGMKSNHVRALNTGEIRSILENADLDFDSVVNDALNAYLPKIFLSCPFTDELCLHKKQCIGCDNSQINKGF